jgi:hypothetical protein
MAELMLINPKRRRRHTAKRRRRRRHNPWYDQRRRHQRAAHLGWSRRKRGRRRRRNPIAANPRRYRRHHYRRRNPRGMGGMVQSMLMPAATAAVGAIGIDALLGYIPLPANLKTGPMRYLVKGAAAVGVGMLLEKMRIVRPKTAQLFAMGALTVAFADAGKDAISRFAPGLAARIGASPAVAGLGYYGDQDLMGLGYSGAGYTGVDDESMGSLGYYPGEEMYGLGADTGIEEFEL